LSQSTRVTDRRTDRWTDRQNYDSQDRPRIYSRGKNVFLLTDNSRFKLGITECSIRIRPNSAA